MNETRTLTRCGKPVAPSGRPCMRVTGHYGNCLPGIIDLESSYDDYGELGPAPDYYKLNRRFFSAPMIISFVFMMMIVAQIVIDVFLIVR